MIMLFLIAPGGGFMKRCIYSFLIGAFCCCVSGCNTGPSVSSVSLIADYDYGQYIENCATSLLGGSLFFFQPTDYGIASVVAGDTFIIEYEGDFTVQEIYPSTVDTSAMEIKDIRVEMASVINLEIVQKTDDGFFLKSVEDDSLYQYNGSSMYVLTSEASYCVMDESAIGSRLYGTCVSGDDSKTLVGLYNFYPRVAYDEETASLSALYPWIEDLKEEDIDYGLHELNLGTIQPGLSVYNSYRKTAGAEALHALYTFLKTEKVMKAKDPYWAGGTSESLTVFLKDGQRYDFYSYYRGFYYGGQYHVFTDSLPTFTEFYGYSFLSHAVRALNLFCDGTEIAFDSAVMSRWIFKEAEDLPVDAAYAAYSLRGLDGQVQFLNSQAFAVEVDGQRTEYSIVNGYSLEDCLL